MDQTLSRTAHQHVQAAAQLARQVARAIDKAAADTTPFFHLRLAEVFPADVYNAMLTAMPVAADYRPMHGRAKDRANEAPTRVKIDLFPEYIRHLPPEQRSVWNLVGDALRSEQVKQAFVRRLAPGLRRRFGDNYAKVGLYPIPILTRDIPGYRIIPHPDTHWKAITVQFYLPRDHATPHIGTIFHERLADDSMPKRAQMAFVPNSGYAFAVHDNTWHSADTVGPEVTTRDSILLTYFHDSGPLLKLRNRAKRLGNFLLNESRQFGP